jgi:methyltransferase
MRLLTLGVLAFVPMIVEARHAARNDRRLRAAGAIEPQNDVYALMRAAYPACFLAMIGEGWLRGSSAGAIALAGLAIFMAAKVLKYWAIVTLGARWSFRVLVPPGSTRITSGPYAYLRHPNYVAVVGELLGMAVMARAPLSGGAALLAFSALILARIRVEERELGLRE